ncbi:MAG TPA: PEP-CTERM sorting domain-containing protein [Planctomycetota bacterium]|nr:PEP-CTERM sorting domain-containing protein [Planctomycetota bacterium]
MSNSVFSGNSSGEHTGGDLVMTGFVDGNLTLNNVSFTSNNADVAIRVSGDHDGGTPRLPISAATISMTDVTISGTQTSNGAYPSAAIVISRLKDLTPADITFDNVVINSTADYGLFLGTVTDSDMDLAGEVAFNGTFSEYAIALGQHGNSSSYALATVDVDAIGLGLTEGDVWDFDDNAALGNVTVEVPEPTTLLLVGSGLAGLATVARRKRRR